MNRKWEESQERLTQLDRVLREVQEIKDPKDREVVMKGLRAGYVRELYKRMDLVDELL